MEIPAPVLMVVLVVVVLTQETDLEDLETLHQYHHLREIRVDLEQTLELETLMVVAAGALVNLVYQEEPQPIEVEVAMVQHHLLQEHQ